MNSSQGGSREAGNSEQVKRDYWCFISYRHADNKEPGRQWATWLHQALETYEVPSDLVGTQNERGDIIPDRIFPVFRDEEELPADADLSSPIEAALRRSRFLVVLCSPQAAQSRFVASEILRFKVLGKKDRILAAILAGEPNASDDPAKGGADKECFPEPLRFDVDEAGRLTEERTEPIAANFRLADGTPGWTSPAAYRDALKQTDVPEKQIDLRVADYTKQQNLMLLKIVAGVLGVPLGVLTKRDKAYQLEKQKQRARVLRRWLIALAALALLTIASALWAWQKQREAIAAAKLAEERQYLSGIQAAAAHAEDGNFSAARQTLVTLPKDQRRREWFLLMEWAGPPMFRVNDLEGWMKQNEPQQPQLIAQIRAAGEVIAADWAAAAKDSSKRAADIKSADGFFRILINHYGGRHGASALVVSGEAVDRDAEAVEFDPSKNPSAIMRISTENYGGIGSAAFTPDSSMLVVQIADESIIREYSEPPVHNLGDQEGTTYVIPLPNRFYPAKAAKPADAPQTSTGDDKDSEANATETTKTESEKTETETTETETTETEETEREKESENTKNATEKKVTISIAARHGKDVVAHVLLESPDGESELDRFGYERVWPGKGKLSPDASTALPAEYEGASRVNLSLLPTRVALTALQLLAPVEGKPRRGLAAVRVGPARTEGLFLVAGGSVLLERWDLEKNELLGQLGEGVPSGEFEFSDMVDWGGAYNAAGTRVLVLPENGSPQIFDLGTGKRLQMLPEIPFAGGKARGADALLGFSLSGKYIYASILERVHPSNSIWIAEKRADDFVPLTPGTVEPAESTAAPSVTPGDAAEEERMQDDAAGEDVPINRDPDVPSRFVAWSPDDMWRFYVSDEGESLRAISADGVSRSSIANAVRTGAYPVFDQLAVAAENAGDGRYALGGFIFGRGGPDPILRLPIAWMDPEMRSVIFRNKVGNYELVTGSLAPGADQPVETAAMLLLKWWISMADNRPAAQRGTLRSKEAPKPNTSGTASPAAAVSPVASPSPTADASPSVTASPIATASSPVRSLPTATSSPAARVSPAAMRSPSTAAETSGATISEAEADRQLNVAYTALRKSLTQAAKEKLKREQMEWLKRRDAILDPEARSKFIQQRTAELELRARK